MLGPELVGFVLLDPLWEGGSEMGYVSSICRMKRTAHQGERPLGPAALLAAVFVGTDDDNVLAPANVICPNEWVINFFDNEFWEHSGISCMWLVLQMSGKKTTKTISPSIYIL